LKACHGRDRIHDARKKHEKRDKSAANDFTLFPFPDSKDRSFNGVWLDPFESLVLGIGVMTMVKCPLGHYPD
jgi:hypothetical protein